MRVMRGAISGVAAAAWTVLFAAAGAVSGADAPVQQAPEIPPATSWASYAYLIVALAGVCVLGMRTSRRSLE